MIKIQETPYNEEEINEALHPFVREWFFSKFKEFSSPQRFSILNIERRINTLISSPTGSGKTLSAFLSIINHLVTLFDKGQLEDRVYAVYISPLKSLANDIDKNLKQPLKEINEIAKKYNRKIKIRVATRTGDTPPSEKQKMLRKPPHILITTPESFAIIMTTKKFSELVKPVEYVVVDEIHSIASNKRGSHLSITLERLAEKTRFTRIGLSATVAPLKEVAEFLVGLEEPEKKIYRDCVIVDSQFIKKLDLKVLSPVNDLINISHEEMQKRFYQLIHELIQSHRTTLIFTNTRSATERVVYQLKERFPDYYIGIIDGDIEEEKIEEEEKYEKLSEELSKKEHSKGIIGAHHSSLSKTHRFNIEKRLKNGELKAVVCSTSLELGIDIGYIDLVILLGSPKGVARALQRIGRSGHRLHDTAKGRIVVLDIDDLVECSILLKAGLEKKIDNISIPQNPLDVLAQQIYGIAISDVRNVEDVYNMIRRAYPYRNLKKDDFYSVISYLAGDYSSLEERNVYGKIWYDTQAKLIGRKGKLARILFMTNVGTIPEQTSVKVMLNEQFLGNITEEFLERLKPGDVFVLGGEVFEFRYSRGMKAYVKTSGGRSPTVPSWISEMLPLSYDLALEIQKFRLYLWQMFNENRKKEEILEYIDKYLYIDKNSVEAIYNYFYEQHNFSIIPHEKRILIEHFRDGNKKYAIFHTLYGRRVNDVLSRAVAYVVARINKMDVEVSVNDNGFYLKSTTPMQVKRALKMLKSDELEDVMNKALEKSEVLSRRFRHCAMRALMILKSYKGEKKSVGRQQVSSKLLMNAIKKIDDNFPILKEARREVLEDLMDIIHAKEIIEKIENEKIKIEERFTELPSPFAFNIILQGYSDILKMEERREFIKRMHALVMEHINGRNIKNEEKKLLPNPNISYESLWEKQEEERIKKEENYVEYLHQLLREVGRKTKLPKSIEEEAHKLIDGEEPNEEFKKFIKDLLSKTVPRVWKDELIRLFKERLL